MFCDEGRVMYPSYNWKLLKKFQAPSNIIKRVSLKAFLYTFLTIISNAFSSLVVILFKNHQNNSIAPHKIIDLVCHLVRHINFLFEFLRIPFSLFVTLVKDINWLVTFFEKN